MVVSKLRLHMVREIAEGRRRACLRVGNAHSSITAILTEKRRERREGRKRQQRAEIATLPSLRPFARSSGMRGEGRMRESAFLLSGFSITVGRGHKSRDNYLGGRNRKRQAVSTEERGYEGGRLSHIFD